MTRKVSAEVDLVHQQTHHERQKQPYGRQHTYHHYRTQRPAYEKTNLFQELDAVIHLLMEAKHWGLRKSRNATSLNSRFKSLDTLKVKIISVTFRRVIRTNHKKASKIWRHENIQLGGCQS